MVVAHIAALSECLPFSFLSALMFLDWAQEHRLLMDGAAVVLALLQEEQWLGWMTPRTEQGLDLLGKLVAVHWWRNVPALDSWFEKVLDEGKSLPSWDQLAEEMLQEHGPGGWGRGPRVGEEARVGNSVLSLFIRLLLFVQPGTVDSVYVEKCIYLVFQDLGKWLVLVKKTNYK